MNSQSRFVDFPKGRHHRAIASAAPSHCARRSGRSANGKPPWIGRVALHPQFGSCYVSTASDDLEGIFKAVDDNAKRFKWAGGLGNDWTSIRATNSGIHCINGRSQGVIPFLKVVNDAAVAVNQGGQRQGAVYCYLES